MHNIVWKMVEASANQKHIFLSNEETDMKVLVDHSELENEPKPQHGSDQECNVQTKWSPSLVYGRYKSQRIIHKLKNGIYFSGK